VPTVDLVAGMVTVAPPAFAESNDAFEEVDEERDQT
jgi:hypothetical protein